MKSIRINNNLLSYDEQGRGDAILLLSGWCQDHRLFKHLAPALASSFRVLRLDWRGHGVNREHNGEFEVEHQIDDIEGFLEALKIDTVLPVSTSHGGWANIGLTDRLGAARIPRSVVIDWIMVTPNEDFHKSIAEIQQFDKWEQGRRDLFDYWIGETDNQDIVNHVNEEMAGYSFEMWARSGREIARAYARWGNPLQRIAELDEKRPIMHVFSQPTEEAYHTAQRKFAAANPWFNPIKLPGKTHFPTLEQPAAVAETIRQFAAG